MSGRYFSVLLRGGKKSVGINGATLLKAVWVLLIVTGEDRCGQLSDDIEAVTEESFDSWCAHETKI